MASLPRAAIAGRAGDDNGAIILVPESGFGALGSVDRDRARASRTGGRRCPRLCFRKVRNAGAIFLGRHAPEAVGDYVAGTNHVLPTARAARFASGLGVLDFLKRTSLVGLDRAALEQLGPAAQSLAEAEGLDAHARSVALRLRCGQ